jgi:hypothetical protein
LLLDIDWGKRKAAHRGSAEPSPQFGVRSFAFWQLESSIFVAESDGCPSHEFAFHSQS